MLVGGIYHPFAETAAAIKRCLSGVGVETETTDDIDTGFVRLAEGGFDLLTVHCLRWSMTQHAKYAPFRKQYEYLMRQSARDAILDHLARGGGLLGIHTAGISFDDWPEWRDVLGAAWRWGQSYHPPIGPIEVVPSST